VKVVWIMETWVRTFSCAFTSPIWCIQALGPSNSCFAGRLWPWGFFFFFFFTRRAREVYLLWLRPQQLKPRDTERGSDNPISLEHLSLWLRFLVSRSSPWGTEIETGNLDSASWGDTWLTAKSQLWLELDHMVGTEFYRDHLMSLHLCNSSKCFPLYALKTFDTFDF